MAKWQRAVCVFAALAAGATMATNCVFAIQRGNYSIAFNKRLRALDERRQQIEMPSMMESSRLQYAWANADIDREARRLYAERSFTMEGHANSQFLLIGAAATCLFAVGLTLGVSWWGVKPQPIVADTAPGSNVTTAG